MRIICNFIIGGTEIINVEPIDNIFILLNKLNISKSAKFIFDGDIYAVACIFTFQEIEMTQDCEIFIINNKDINNQVIEIIKQITKEKNKIKILIEENTRLKTLNDKLNINVKKLEKEINSLHNKMKKNQSLFDNNNAMSYTITTEKIGEKIMAINFVSIGIQDIGHYCLPCKNTDIFVKLEEKLNNDFPKLKEYETFFEVNGKRIKRFKTLEENKIKSNDIINIFLIES